MQALPVTAQDTLGPDEWFNVETKCLYDDKNGTVYNVFDAGESPRRTPQQWLALCCLYGGASGSTLACKLGVAAAALHHAELTELGQEQGRYLNSILDGGGWFSKMTGNRSVRAIVSPLSRCLQTSLLISQNLPIDVSPHGGRNKRAWGARTARAAATRPWLHEARYNLRFASAVRVPGSCAQKVSVEEYVRETLGEDTCDARR